MKKSIILYLTIIALSVTSACSNHKSKSETNVVLTFVTYNSDFADSGVFSLFEKENPGVKVIVQKVAWSGYSGFILTRIASKNSDIDVYDVVDAHHFLPLISRDVLEPLDSYIDVATKSEYYPFLIDRFSKNGMLYAIPNGVNTSVLLANNDLATQYGLTVPQAPTWDELNKIMSRFKNETEDNVYFPINFIYPIDVLRAYGVPFVDNINKPTIPNLPSVQSVAALDFWSSMYKKKLMTSIDTTSSSEAIGTGAFLLGKELLKFGWISDYAQSSKGKAYETTIHQAPKAVASSGFRSQSAYVVPKISKNKEWAVKLALFLTSKKSYAFVYKKTQNFGLAPKQTLMNHDFIEMYKTPAAFGAGYDNVVKSLESSGQRPFMLYWSKVDSEVTDLNQGLAKGTLTSQEYIDQFRSMLSHYIDEERSSFQN